MNCVRVGSEYCRLNSQTVQVGGKEGGRGGRGEGRVGGRGGRGEGREGRGREGGRRRREGLRKRNGKHPIGTNGVPKKGGRYACGVGRSTAHPELIIFTTTQQYSRPKAQVAACSHYVNISQLILNFVPWGPIDRSATPGQHHFLLSTRSSVNTGKHRWSKQRPGQLIWAIWLHLADPRCCNLF